MKKHYLFNTYLPAFFLLFYTFCFADNSSYTYPECKINAYIQNKPDSAMILIENSIIAAEKNQNEELLAQCYLDKGLLLSKVHPDQAIEYLFKARTIFKKYDNLQKIAMINLHLGSISQMEMKKRIELLEQSLDIFDQIGDVNGKMMCRSNLGSLLGFAGKPESALYNFKRAAGIAKEMHSLNNLAISLRNIGSIEIIYNKDTARALSLYYEALSNLSPEKTIYATEIWHDLMSIHFARKEIDSAFYYYDIIKDHFHLNPRIQALAYGCLSHYYSLNNDARLALLFDAKSDSVTETMRSRNNENQLRLLEIEHEAQMQKQKVSQLNDEIQRSHIIRWALGILLIFTAIFAFILIRQQKQKSEKKRELLKANQELLVSQLKNSELKQKYLSDELKYTNKELSSFASSIIQNQTLWDDVRTRVENISREKNKNEISSQLKELHTMLLQVSTNNNQRYEFIERSRQLNHSLVFYLKTHYEMLTEKDINLLILILLKFTPKEIAILYNIETESVKKKRHRVRKKLGLQREESLRDFFKRIMAKVEMKGAE